MSSLSIIIPTLFSPPHLASYAARLAHYQPVTEVIVVVNGKGQDYTENTVQWHFLGKNKGFTGACNEGTRRAKGNLLLFLNDDCQLEEESLLTMIAFIEGHPELAATQPVMYKKEGEGTGKQIENVGFFVDTKIGKAIAVSEVSAVSPKHQALSTKHNLFGLSGTCLLIKKDIFQKVQMFDDSFHSYLEDVDLALRLQKAGYAFAPCLDASATHEHMGTSRRMGLYKPMQDVKNWWRLILKHPDVFRMSVPLFIERLRNISGLLKAVIRL